MKQAVQIIAATLLLACNTGPDKESESAKAPVVTGISEYEGVLPCADCPGIQTNLRLLEDSSLFILTEKYEGRKGIYQEKGAFELHPADTTMVLTLKNGKRFFKVAVGQLIQLDQNGTSIKGSSTGRYILKKIH
ncbi:hypothetical protein A8C56_11765 [Niabella ginsenosidivorans]|uniref:Copper resistance protein NlpE n=1 Tax=Niabella ginsenosidivorans TaxID=1176587 RepID=A0A1A9I3D1_9BACT|nr:copper resistance protein NlpE [Niabella ginsenosidivorans]ANH81559.1 hypothetical protein A8C56_11765 [Niabella ginsenosidivorans]